LEEYLTHWWAGELALYYQPFGLTMFQFNKLMKLGQYLFGLMSIFELIQFSTMMRQIHVVSVMYFMLNRLPWALLNIPVTLVPKLLTGVVSVLRREIPLRDLLNAILLPHVQTTVKRVRGSTEEMRIAKLFKWLADHPLPDSVRRVFVFVGFSALAFADLMTS
jgi:hypothetical protein